MCSCATLSLYTWCRSPKTVAKRKLSLKTCCRSLKTVVKPYFFLWWVNPLAGVGVSIARNCSETQILSSGIAPRIVLDVSMLTKLSFECGSYIVFCNSGLRWSAYSYCVLQFRVALVCVFLLCFAIQGCAGLRVLLCFAIQGCAGLRILFVFCNSGLRWSAYSYCAFQLRVALVCVFLWCFAIQVALVCKFLLCFATQGWAGLRILIVFCNSGLRSSA